MTAKTRLEIELSEKRQRINELLSSDSLTDEQREELTTLTTRIAEAETEYRAACVAEASQVETTEHVEVDAEERERRELRSKANLGRAVAAAIGGRGLSGAELEYSQSQNIEQASAGVVVPLDMAGPTTEQRQAEFRQRRQAFESRNVTPAPADGSVAKMQAPVVPAIFDRSVAPFLGIEMPSVGVGIASYPVITTSLTGGMVDEDAAAAHTAAAYTVTSADPRRLSGSFSIRKEDTAKLADLEPSLQLNLQMVLSDALDNQVLNGDNADGELNGILQQLGDPTAPAAGAETYARYQTALSSHIDGLFATGPMDVAMLAGPHTTRHMLGVYRANEDRFTAYDLATSTYGGVRTTRRIADPAGNIQQSVIRRSNPAGDRVAVAPVWLGLELVRDPYTEASKGQIIVTGCVLVGGVVILRSGVFVQDSFRLAA